MISGILFGLGAATSQSLSYLFSRSFLSKHGSSLELMIIAHMIMALYSIVTLLFIPSWDIPPVSKFALPMLLCSLSYVLGQFAFFMAIKHAEASRISPLLGLKIIVIAILSVSFFSGDLSIVQWLAVSLCLCGALLSNWSGGSMPLPGILWLLFACLGYSLSDIYIRFTVDALGRQHLIVSSITATALVYIFCGLLALPFLLFVSKGTIKKVKPAFPFATAWYGAMLLLFCCFATIGPVYGNIVQATRGIISILIGTILAHIGYAHLETKVSTSTLIRRIIAALMIMGAIIIFSRG